MRVVIQRVKKAQVDIEGKTVGSIDQGLVVLLGIEMADSLEDVIWIVKKIYKIVFVTIGCASVGGHLH